MTTFEDEKAEEEIVKCGVPHPRLAFASCGLDQWWFNPKTRKRERHKMPHGAFAQNPGQLIGNQPWSKPATTWGAEEKNV